MKRIVLSFICVVMSMSFIFAQKAELQSDIMEKTLPSPPKPKGRPSVALVLSGGGARGFAHLPVIEMLQEENIPIDMIIGTSAGSIVGGLYASGYSVDEIYNSMYKFSTTPVLSDSVSSPFDKVSNETTSISTPLSMTVYKDASTTTLAGLTTGQKIYQLLKSMTLKIPSDISFDELKIPFRAVAVNLLNAKVEIRSNGDLAEAMRSSISMPSVFEPFKIDDQYYIDGGTLDNTPIDVAVKMGYDIVIVSEITQYLNTDEKKYKNNLVLSFWQSYNFSQANKNEINYQFADAIFLPDTLNASSYSYTKAKKIYNASKKSIEKERPRCKEIYNKIYGSNSPESIAQLNNQTERKFNDNYEANGYIQVSHLELENANKSDIKYINSLFNKIKGQVFDDDNFNYICDSIYNTGKYSNIVTRVYDDNTLKIILNPLSRKNVDLNLGLTYVGTYGASTVSNLNLCAGVQAEGLTGHGSSLSFNAAVVNGVALQTIIRQPIISGLFFQASALYKKYNESWESGFCKTYDAISGMATNNEYFTTNAEFGTQFSNGKQLVLLGGSYSIASSSISDLKYTYSCAGAYGEFVQNSLDSLCLPTKGLYLSLKETVLVPVDEKYSNSIADITAVDTSVAIPLNHNISIVTNGTAGINFSKQLTNIGPLTNIYSLSLYDRLFFPQYTISDGSVNAKAAVNLSLRFSPDTQLSVFGMKIFYYLSGSFGNTWTYDSDILKAADYQWCAAGNIALRVNNSFGILLRGGAGSNIVNKIYPFISLDIGNVRF